MCFKKIASWFHKPDPVIDPIPDPIPGQKRKIALLFAINDYPGSSNDLNGCINDQTDLIKKLSDDFPGFIIRSFMNQQVTRVTFINEIRTAIRSLIPGDVLLIHYSGHGTQVYDKDGDEEDGYDEAVYLYDGTVIDDDIGDSLQGIVDGATVVIALDSCFSGTATRAPITNWFKISKYVQNPNLKKRRKKRIRFQKSEMKWIVFSGCSEQQTSADAYINGRYNGAFTYYALKALSPGITYREWISKINSYLPNKDFDQIPTLEGQESLFDLVVFT